VTALAEPFESKQVDLVVGIEARGFIFAPIVAFGLKAGFVPVRKRREAAGPDAQGKL